VRSCAIFQGRFKAPTSDNKDAGERADKRTWHMYVKAEMSPPQRCARKRAAHEGKGTHQPELCQQGFHVLDIRAITMLSIIAHVADQKDINTEFSAPTHDSPVCTGRFCTVLMHPVRKTVAHRSRTGAQGEQGKHDQPQAHIKQFSHATSR
jgi:hypothetical protein